ncbi:hypothetical protein WICPIJ_006201 [Wickerhamomyces pijperi]|uniref:Fe2OG dioxygenase domain-containing protein n=1 Tax=Wickerhamomyces pijperi TaxID=599730 RepID=A0A9P8Q2I3_WICPI|nr:hypothetical protein WICPIJ_006201 [Wickerhamomyces pijperi]
MPPKKPINSRASKADKPNSTTSLKFPNDLNYKQPKFMISEITEVSPQIITISNFFNSEYLGKLISRFQTLNLETTPLIKSKEYALRFNDRISITDEISAANLWTHLQSLLLESSYNESITSEFQQAKGLNPNLRVYRYEKGHHFEKHYDESVKVSTSNLKGQTKWTLLIYLTGGDELLGGDTIFYDEMVKGKAHIRVHPEPGLALLHKHGDDCLLHEAEVVKKGVKWVLRSDVVF